MAGSLEVDLVEQFVRELVKILGGKGVELEDEDRDRRVSSPQAQVCTNLKKIVFHFFFLRKVCNKKRNVLKWY